MSLLLLLLLQFFFLLLILPLLLPLLLCHLIFLLHLHLDIRRICLPGSFIIVPLCVALRSCFFCLFFGLVGRVRVFVFNVCLSFLFSSSLCYSSSSSSFFWRFLLGFSSLVSLLACCWCFCFCIFIFLLFHFFFSFLPFMSSSASVFSSICFFFGGGGWAGVGWGWFSLCRHHLFLPRLLIIHLLLLPGWLSSSSSSSYFSSSDAAHLHHLLVPFSLCAFFLPICYVSFCFSFCVLLAGHTARDNLVT